MTKEEKLSNVYDDFFEWQYFDEKTNREISALFEDQSTDFLKDPQIWLKKHNDGDKSHLVKNCVLTIFKQYHEKYNENGVLRCHIKEYDENTILYEMRDIEDVIANLKTLQTISKGRFIVMHEDNLHEIIGYAKICPSRSTDVHVLDGDVDLEEFYVLPNYQKWRESLIDYITTTTRTSGQIRCVTQDIKLVKLLMQISEGPATVYF